MISGKDVRIENGYIIINGRKCPIVQDVSEIEGELETLSETVGDDTSGLVKDVSSLVEQTGFLSFTHFVQIPYTKGILDSIETAFENGTIPLDVFGITFGVVKGEAGSQRAVFIAQNQTLGVGQTRCGAVYFGAYTTPRFCFKQDNTGWSDIALS